jgi:peptidoglycan/xylan/chitin deacetylase (PgdA/CDA1 family)
MGKRILLANTLTLCKLDKLTRRINNNVLTIFNYHRIFNEKQPPKTKFDNGVFGVSQKILYEQLNYLKKHTKILDEPSLIKKIKKGKLGKGPFSMITFDDGYIDNYQLAIPILKKLNLTAAFFIPYSLIEKRILGWWDQIAYIIKNSSKKHLNCFGYNSKLQGNKLEAIAFFHQIMKTLPFRKTVNLIKELSDATDSLPPSSEEMSNQLMTWKHIKEIQNQGHTIGSHTCRHLVLATLEPQEQLNEIAQSKKLIEAKIGTIVRSIAYPVGGTKHFNNTTQKLVVKTGYNLAFSFNTGSESLSCLNPYAVPRVEAPKDLQTFKAKINFPQLMVYKAKPTTTHPTKANQFESPNYCQ